MDDRYLDEEPKALTERDFAFAAFLILYLFGNPDTRVQAGRLEAVLKEAEIPVRAYGKRDSNHSRLNNDLGKPDDPATQQLYKFLDPLVGGD